MGSLISVVTGSVAHGVVNVNPGCVGVAEVGVARPVNRGCPATASGQLVGFGCEFKLRSFVNLARVQADASLNCDGAHSIVKQVVLEHC